MCFFAVCHTVKLIGTTKHFRPLLEDDTSRRRKLPTSHSCPADLAVSDPELPLERDENAHAEGSHPQLARDERHACRGEVQLEPGGAGTGRRCGEGLRTAERHWVAVPTSPCTKHSEACRVQSAEKPPTESTIQAWLRNLKQKKNPLSKPPRRGPGVGRVRVFR